MTGGKLDNLQIYENEQTNNKTHTLQEQIGQIISH